MFSRPKQNRQDEQAALKQALAEMRKDGVLALAIDQRLLCIQTCDSNKFKIL